MSSIVIILLAVLIFTALSIGGIYLLYKILVNFQPSNSKIKQDLIKLRSEIEPWVDQLVPWQNDELELLSLKQTNRVLKKGIITSVKGVFTSIYHEPMIAYAYKRYFAGGANAILYARTSHHEFSYRIRKDGVQIHIDNQFIGQLKNGGLLYSASTNRLIARINRDDVSGFLPVVVGERELGSLSKPSETMSTNTRAFQFLNEKITQEEEALLLSMSILEMVGNELPPVKK
ncbi:MAG: hypothetical protein AAGG75_27895 [Bacteroidota bacterium]